MRPLAASTFVLCASPAYLAAQGCPQGPEELPGHAGLMPAVAVPSFLAAAALREGHLQRVLPDWHGGRLTLHAAMPTRRHLPARTRAFVDLLVQRFGGSRAQDPWLALCEPEGR